MIIFESLDSDSHDRRISPVGFRSDTGYIDLINGPSAHKVRQRYKCNYHVLQLKGDHGYSAVNRLSLFNLIAAPGHAYELAFTGSMPQTARIHNPTAEDSGNQ